MVLAHWHRRRLEGTLRLFAVLLLPSGGVVGCSRPLRPIFEKPEPPLVWPPAPAPARIRYVGQLTSSVDLKPARKPFQALGDFLVGAKAPARLYGPRSVVRSKDGARVWIADSGGRCLHLFNLEDRSYRKVSRAGDTLLLSPVGLCRGPQDSIFVVDAEGAAIHRLSGHDGTLLHSLRLTDEVRRPVALSYDGETEELFVVDVAAHDLKVLDLRGRLRRIIGKRGREKGEFNYPCDIAADGDLLWVVDTGNHRVQGLTREGDPVASFGQAGTNPGNLALPKAIAVDSAGHLYVVDARFENVQIFDRSGDLLLFFGEEGIGPGEFWLPGGIFIDHDDRIWICDSYNKRVQVFDYVSRVTEEEGG